MDATYSYQIEVLANGKMQVPGIEPVSALSSTTLSVAMKDQTIALVDVKIALDAIPGSFVKYGNNFGKGGIRQRWYVLPPITPECPCGIVEDYYRILRRLASNDAPITEKYDTCDLIGMGYCPSPDFNSTPAPEPDPYQTEGTYFAGSGTLPKVPPWYHN